MPLSAYCAAVLARELADPAYDGLTADQGWAWLMLPTPQGPAAEPTGVRLTPRVAARVVGAAKAEAIAAALRQQFPVTADFLMTEGIDPAAAETQAFLAQLQQVGTLEAGDVAALAAVGTRSVPRPDLPRRFDARFAPAPGGRWWHVAADGSPGGDADPALSGFPNDLDRADFDAAWAAAGRN